MAAMALAWLLAFRTRKSGPACSGAGWRSADLSTERQLAIANLPISPKIPYHSIIAITASGVDRATASDGVVPYRSAHLEGAASELVLADGHSVKENPTAILEIRRILRQGL